MELIIADDASPLKNETLTVFRRHEPALRAHFGSVLTEFRNSNLGFARNYNLAATRARGRVLVIANSDLYFTRGSIRRLVDTLESNPRYGIAGPLCNDCYSPQKVSLIGRLEDYSPESLERIERFTTFIFQQNRPPVISPYLSGFCFAIRRETVERFGLFDETFEQAYFEDYDLCYRIRKEFDLVIDAHTYIHHGGLAGGSSSLWSQHSALWNTRRFLKNGWRFAQRYGIAAWLAQVWHQNCSYHLRRCNLTRLFAQAWPTHGERAAR